jgi:beta-galactosidase/beta-glucuronidase
MLTRWGKALNAERVLDDYPRPQMVRDDWMNLNGVWQYTISPISAAQPTDWEGDIVVPFCVESPLSGVERTLSPTERLWYRRTFSLTLEDKRTLLHFGAVDDECVVWINGGLAGAHSGGFDPFTLDITAFVRSGENEILVGVTDPSSSDDQPRGKQHLKPQGIWYTPVTGIWQTVWLEQVPVHAHIEELQITPSAGCDAVDFTAYLFRPSRDSRLAIRLTIRLGDKVINEVTVRPDRRVNISIPQPALWSPDEPTLYDVDVELLRIRNPLPEPNDQQTAAQLVRDIPLRGPTEAAYYAAAELDGAESIDRVQGYFGLRSITLGPHPEGGHPTLLLNGEAVFHLGSLDQGWWPDGLHTPPADEAMIYEIEYLKAAGFNTLRKHIKVEPARYYYHCDRLGILVWQDMPSGFLPAQFVAPNDEDEVLRSSRSTERFERTLQRMIYNLRHHPCIVVWVLHNEGWGQFDSHRLSARITELDPTRVVNAVSGWLDTGAGDIIDKHDYQAEPSPPESDGRRALVVGEYGGIGWPLEEHLWNPEMRNWGYQTFHTVEEVQAAYRKVTDAIINMYREHGLSGAIYTQTTDVEGEVNGLITYDRSVEKFPTEWLAEVHGPLNGQKHAING